MDFYSFAILSIIIITLFYAFIKYIKQYKERKIERNEHNKIWRTESRDIWKLKQEYREACKRYKKAVSAKPIDNTVISVLREECNASKQAELRETRGRVLQKIPVFTI